MITKEELIRIGKNKGLTNKEHIEKAYFQDLFLYHLYKESNFFVFKGGTLLYKLYGLKRFSEDLDFSLSEKINTEKLIEIIKKVVSKIPGFEMKDIKESKESLLFKISCEGILTRYNSLRLDVSLINKIFMGYELKIYVPDFIDIVPFSLKTLKPEEIISEKTHSLLNRKKARDLYDLFFLLRQFKFNKNLLDKKLKIFNMKYSFNKIKDSINSLNKIWKKELNPFVLEELPDFNSVKDYVIKKLS